MTTMKTEAGAFPGHTAQAAVVAVSASAGALFPDPMRDDVLRLATRRLWLRWPRHADVPALRSFASRREVAEMTGTWPHPMPEGEAERRIFAARKANATGSRLILALTPRTRPDLQIGSIGVGPVAEGVEDGVLEIGYMLHPDHWGQGLMVEAAQAVLNAVFGYTATRRVTAWTRVINPASRRVLEKCGFRHAGTAMRNLPARGGMQTCDSFELDRKTWAALVNWGHSAPARGSALPEAKLSGLMESPALPVMAAALSGEVDGTASGKAR